MGNPISMSLHPDELNSDSIAEFAEEEIDFIELYFTGEYPETYSTVAGIQDLLKEYDIDVITNHGTRIEDLGTEKGVNTLRGHVNNILLGYDESGDRNVDLQENLLVINYHAPYRKDSDLSDDQMRLNTVKNLQKVTSEIRDAGRNVKITLENSAADNNLLSSPEEVGIFRDIAEDLGFPDLYFTCDVGHAENPLEMIDTMGSRTRNVHIHDVIEEDHPNVDDLMGAFPKHREDDELMDYQERPGMYTHLPVGRGDLPTQQIISRLDDYNYAGPITVELNARFKTERGWTESRDVVQNYLDKNGSPNFYA